MSWISSKQTSLIHGVYIDMDTQHSSKSGNGIEIFKVGDTAYLLGINTSYWTFDQNTSTFSSF